MNCFSLFFVYVFATTLSQSDADIADLMFGDRSIPPQERLFPLLSKRRHRFRNYPDYGDELPPRDRGYERPDNYNKLPGPLQNNYNSNPPLNQYHEEPTQPQSNNFRNNPNSYIGSDKDYNSLNKKEPFDAVVSRFNDMSDKIETNKSNSEEKHKHKERRVLKPITKKKFFFQAKPVRPLDETATKKETVYYID